MKELLIDLEKLPRKISGIRIRVSRRGMLSAAADAAEERIRSQEGIPSYRIEDLPALDEDTFGALFPAVNKKAGISLSKGIVYAETSASVDPIPLFDLDSPALFIFNQFNGIQTMEEAVEKTAAYTGWDEERARETVRAVFLKLCEVRVCEPGRPD